MITTADDETNLTEPSSPTHGEYLWVKAERSLSGHIREVDDTPGAERLLEMHKSGTFREIHPDGTQVIRIYGDNFQIALLDNNLIVGGDLNITVQGNSNILTKGDVKQKIGGDYSLVVHGDMTTRVEGERMDYTKGDHDIQTASNLAVRSEGKTDLFASEALNIQTKGVMSFDAEGDMIHYTSGKGTVSCGSSWNVRSEGNTNINSGGTMYLDGSTVRLNDPGPGVNAIDPETNDPTDQDPTGGLTIEDSVCDPSLESLMITKSTNASLSGIVDSEITLPEDRTALNSE